MIPIILCGGSGTRLWPLSRKMYPKQFLNILDDETLLQKTLLRLQGLDCDPPIIVCNEEHRYTVAEQARQVGITEARIILEPFGKNTAPAITVAALWAHQIEQNASLLVLSADHELRDDEVFRQSITQAQALLEDGRLVTFGIVPTRPATGYGYIRRGSPVGCGYEVSEFVEKPDLAVARKYLESSDYYWNSGMFMFNAGDFLAELSRLNPEILGHSREAIKDMVIGSEFNQLNPEAFALCESESIDYAVMEKTKIAVVVPMEAGWSDIGCWKALWVHGKKDLKGNVIYGDVINYDTKESYIHAESRLVATLGLENIVVVETKDALLVAHKDKVQDVKQIVATLSDQGRPEKNLHRVVYRPWGNFDSVDEGGRYKVKRITVKPGAQLSMQMHHHRAEHWVVVSGTAKVYREKDEFVLTENESIFIPLGQTHSLENPGVIPLEIIEVQSGAYLGEDDIVRFADRYGREGSATNNSNSNLKKQAA